MREENKQLDDFFQIASRFIIIFPIVIIILALFWKFSRPVEPKQNLLIDNLTPTLSGKKENTASPSAKFNLKGPLICSLTTNTSSTSALVKDKKIYVQIKEKKRNENYLLNGDCIYLWQTGSYSGEKICGISSQVEIVDKLLAINLFDPNLIFKNLGQVLPFTPSEKSGQTLSLILSSCKNEKILDLSVFTIPKNILFKNKKLK